ncbi:MAG: DNA-binding response regulator [Candidatus Alkanophagales archaeon MCA70_species_1]|nr:DNA-binding response regulator [Candidatus Alkanophaga volatiphilum]
MGKRIMVVDDDPDIVEMVRRILEAEGYEVVHAYSGVECLELLKSMDRRPDLILLDIMMETINGWETLRRIKSDEVLKEIPVCMLTVVPLTPETATSEDIENIENYIVKPFTKEDILKCVRDILEREREIKDVVGELRKISDEIANEYVETRKYVERHRKLISVLMKLGGLDDENTRRIIKEKEKKIMEKEARLKEITSMLRG